LEQRTPLSDEQRCKDGRIHHREVLGGLLHDYYRRAA
jgi:hypothetical protein